ncbi:MAG: HAMP domain-containing protein, partial [Magnetococcales bacterium]|nr:HAMP domain-containing protein [Magnetococcales bacterium]
MKRLTGFFLSSRRWRLAVLLAVAALFTIVTGQGLYGLAWEGGSTFNKVFFILLYVNLNLILALGYMVARHLMRLWRERRRRAPGYRLRTRMTLLFAALSLVPTLFIAALSVGLLNQGVDSWFSDRISMALEHAVAVARGYYEENQRTIRHDAEDIARNRIVTSSLPLQDADALQSVLEVELKARGLDEVAILRGDGATVAYVGDLPQDPQPDLTGLDDGSHKARVFANDAGNRVRAYVALGSDLYLVTGRWIDRQILGRMETMEAAYVDYNQLRGAHDLLKLTHTTTLLFIALLLLLGALWIGFRIANTLANPITELVVGTRKVSNGDLDVSLSVTGDDELATLMAAFNAMTLKLAENRRELEENYALLEDRRRFIEAVLHNISAGVISVGSRGEITLINPAAHQLLRIDPAQAIGRLFREAAPLPVVEVMPLAPDAPLIPGRGIDSGPGGFQVQVEGPDKPLSLRVRLTPFESKEGERQGFIITFDDITDVLVAQRTSAWSDVARRIAHEIKNPLTPIQLWAQRLRRKYLKPAPVGGDLPSAFEAPDWRILDEGTNVIIKQVEELKVLVNEFSAFARLPRPHLQKDDLNEAVREVLILLKEDLKDLKVRKYADPDLPLFPFDRGQIKQVATNLVSNAAAAILERPDPEAPGQLAIVTGVAENGRMALLSVSDNGPGLPPAHRDRVFEPYFTTKKKGTGLGLAIVKKIVEDHGGVIRLKDSEWKGLCVEVLLPLCCGQAPAPAPSSSPALSPA